MILKSQKVHKTSVSTFAFTLLPLDLTLLFGQYPNINIVILIFSNLLNKIFKSTEVNDIVSLFM